MLIDMTQSTYMETNLEFSNLNPEQNQAVLFSGGCDSAILLWALSKTLPKETNILALSFELSILTTTKIRSERLARKQLLSSIKKKHKRTVETVLIQTDYMHKGESNLYATENKYSGGLFQPGFWAGSVHYIPTQYALSYGYILGDCAFHRENAILKVLDGHCDLQRKDITIQFPLQLLDKYWILALLEQEDIYEQTWFCEEPKVVGEPCGVCTPCSHHLQALLFLRESGHEWTEPHIEKLKEYRAKNAEEKDSTDE